MTEATVGDGAPAVNSFPAETPRLTGLVRGLYCRADAVREFMGWNRVVWAKWKKDGMRTQFPDTQAEYVLTDWVIDYLANRED